MSEFFRFPSTTYLFQPDGVDVRDDKVLTESERAAFLARPLHVEEKLDGQNLGISVGPDGLRFQARGSYVETGGRYFRGLENWVAARRTRLEEGLGDDLILFGEWCAVEHSVSYDALPDWFLVFDVYDRGLGAFWEIPLRDELAADLGLHTVPFLGEGRFEEDRLVRLMDTTSAAGAHPMEGLVARTVDDGPPERAKVVRSNFVQQIEQHWMTGPQTMNRLDTGSGGD
ncbi:MAG: RNA ligase family protein [Gordonia sp. (in: high G+C Gram-positive bacteria)]|uniref:RNA ligase family protein n=1 Tax=Gordonia sp. (in: high G+C Gram-positive bacteria) TaxID=84139 RepID=UPI0039E44C52